jgi:hypothetical protein
MKKKQAMDANMAWAVVDLLHSREKERAPFHTAKLPLSRALGGNRAKSHRAQINAAWKLSQCLRSHSILITSAKSQRPASEPVDLEKRT